VITLVGGTMFLMWMGEQVTARGVGNGVSLIIFAGIVAELPKALFQAFSLNASNAISEILLIGLLVLFVGLSFLIVFIERAQRRLLVQYPKRQMAGGKTFGGESSFMPLKLNTAGVIPPIFASSIILFPSSILSFFAADAAASGNWFAGLIADISTKMQPGEPIYTIAYVGMILFFAFFYTALTFDPKEIATSLLIIVVVIMDMMGQVQSHLMSQQYENLMKKTNLTSGNGGKPSGRNRKRRR